MTQLENRKIAGQQLAQKLKHLKTKAPYILALPRGGVPVAAEIAKSMRSPLDILVVKKISHPSHPELALGAIAEGSPPLWNHETLRALDMSLSDLTGQVSLLKNEIQEKARKWRQNRSKINVKDRTVILVDDGLATGATLQAALKVIRAQKPNKLIIAVPVGPPSSIDALRNQVDEVVTLLEPKDFYAVGQWYKDFAQVTDKDVYQLLNNSKPQFINRQQRSVLISEGDVKLPGELSLPDEVLGLVLFAHGSGSSHKSPRNQKVAAKLNQIGFGTLLFDLLTEKEAIYRENVFDIELLAKRLLLATDWAVESVSPDLPIGYFGASTGAAAALTAAAINSSIKAIVSRGGRPDLVKNYLPQVQAPTLLIVGEEDEAIHPLNQIALDKLPYAEMVTVENAGHLFEEPGTMDAVINYAQDWFLKFLNVGGQHARINRAFYSQKSGRLT